MSERNNTNSSEDATSSNASSNNTHNKNNSKNFLTDRQKDIAIILAKDNSNNFITMAVIAQKLNISTRTVLREIGSIEQWFLENNFNFIKKTGTGIILNETLENKKFILKILDTEYKLKYLSREDRKLIILSTLLDSIEPIKANYFTKVLKISENILTNDFLEIGTWLSEFAISIIRKPGLGAYLIGNEIDFREIYIRLIYENFKEEQLIQLINNNNLNYDLKNSKLFDIIDKAVLYTLKSIIDRNIEKFSINISDNSYIELLIRLCLCTKRLSNQFYISSNDYKKLDIEYDENIIKISNSIYLDIINVFKFDISQHDLKQEVNYICFYFKTLKKLNDEKIKENSLMLNNVYILKIANHLIQDVEDNVKIPISEDSVFFDDLLTHLEPAIYRMVLGVSVKNPFIDEIRDEYTQLYDLIQETLNGYIKILTNNTILPDEIAYITMHFIVSIERILLSKTVINCLVSCPTGIGTSKLLSLKLKEKFKNLEIIGTVSALNINDEKLKQEGIDLIISTVELETNIEFICVSRIISFTDENLIKKKIIAIAKQKINLNNNNLNRESLDDELNKNNNNYLDNNKNNDYFYLMEIGQHILDLKESFMLVKLFDIKDFEELLQFTSKIYLSDTNKSKKLLKELKQRVDLAVPYFEESDLLLLHCVSEYMSTTKVCAVRTNKEVLINNNIFTKNVVLMIMPLEHSLAEQEILSEISINLVNNKNLIKAIKYQEEEDIKELFISVFINFYKTNALNILK